MAENRRASEPAAAGRGRFRWLLWSFALLGWFLALATGGLLWWSWESQQEYYDTTGGVYETFYSGNKKAETRVAILDVSGVILEGYAIEKIVDRIKKDNRIKAVVVRIESPGGTVTGSDYIFHSLRELRTERDIPIVVSMGSIAASGGYYVAMSVGDEKDVIYAEPATITGSIGVILPHYDVSGLMDEYNVRDDSVKSHPDKQMLSMTHRMDEQQRAKIETFVDEMFARFKEVIGEGRPKLVEVNDDDQRQVKSLANGVDLATGEVFNAPTALTHGLVDRIGYLDDAVERALKLIERDADTVRVVRFKHPKPLIELPTLIQANKSDSLAFLLSQPHYPQAWYFSGTPPLLPPPLNDRTR